MDNISVMKAMDVARGVASMILIDNGVPRNREQARLILHLLTEAVATIDVQADSAIMTDGSRWGRVVSKDSQGGGRCGGSVNASNRSK